jgi:hypothetical protein
MIRNRSPWLPRLICLAALCVAGLVACKKDAPPEEAAPSAAAPAESAESRADPRLASGPDAGAAPGPHGGGDAVPRHGGPAGGAGGGRTVEKTADGRVVLGPVTGSLPKDWKDRPTSSGMRAAEWTIPGKAGEAELVVYYFGTGGAGSAEANLDRWLKQFEQPDGTPSADKAKIDKKKVAGMPVTLVEVSGRYVAAVMPGASEKHDKPDHMMLGAIVETSGGPYYFKLVGPQATVTAVKKDFHGFIDSMKPGGSAK